MTDQDAAAGPAASDALAQAEAAAQENWNRYLRTAAELDNVRKRAARDVEQARKFGVERLAADMLAVMDSLERGLEAGGSASADALLEGKKATLRLLSSGLERAGITEVAPAGQQFDPQLHEALSLREAPGVAPGTVVEVVQKGYLLNGRLLRPARVVVAGPEPSGEPGEQPST